MHQRRSDCYAVIFSIMYFMKESDLRSSENRLPRWLTMLFVLGVPAVITVVGIFVGAHFMEIVIYSLLSLFSLALVFFYALG